MKARLAAGTVAAAVLAVLGTTVTPAEAVASPTLRTKAYNVAVDQLGDDYVRGAEGPDAFDCSGLTWYSYRKAGRVWGRTAADEQRRNQTVDISSAQATRGDLIFFRRKGSSVYTHVGINAGGGYMINAVNGSTRKGVVKGKIVDGYWNKYYVADWRRVK